MPGWSGGVGGTPVADAAKPKTHSTDAAVAALVESANAGRELAELGDLG